MTNDLFKEWVQKRDRMFRDKARNIELLVNNCPAHPDVSNLTNMKLIFEYHLPTPTDEPGFIRGLKAQYHLRVVRMCINALDKNQPLPKISIFQVMTTDTFESCATVCHR